MILYVRIVKWIKYLFVGSKLIRKRKSVNGTIT